MSLGSESKLDLERQVQKLRDMLEESEDQVAALRAQEKVNEDVCVTRGAHLDSKQHFEKFYRC